MPEPMPGMLGKVQDYKMAFKMVRLGMGKSGRIEKSWQTWLRQGSQLSRASFESRLKLLFL